LKLLLALRSVLLVDYWRAGWVAPAGAAALLGA
jgi:hypothetical protein